MQTWLTAQTPYLVFAGLCAAAFGIQHSEADEGLERAFRGAANFDFVPITDALAHKLRTVLDQPGVTKPDGTRETLGFTKSSIEGNIK